MGLFSEWVYQSSQLFDGILRIQLLSRWICIDDLSPSPDLKVHLDVARSTSVLGEVEEGCSRHVLVVAKLQHPGGVVLQFV